MVVRRVAVCSVLLAEATWSPLLTPVAVSAVAHETFFVPSIPSALAPLLRVVSVPRRSVR